MDKPARRIVLNIRDDDGIDSEYTYDMAGTADSTIDAINFALEDCPYDILGLERVEHYDMADPDEQPGGDADE